MKTIKQVSSSEIAVAGSDAKAREVANSIVRDNLGKPVIVVGVGDVTVVLLRGDYADFLRERGAEILGVYLNREGRSPYSFFEVAESVAHVPNGYRAVVFHGWLAWVGGYDAVCSKVRNLPKMPEPVKVTVHSFE